MKRVEDYKPTPIKSSRGDICYYLFLVEAQKCPVCKEFMIGKPEKHYSTRNTFPHYHHITFEAQVKKAGLRLISDVYQTGHYICEDCAKAGKGKFKCTLCGKKQSVKEIHKSYGDCSFNGDYVCKTCYGTVSAEKFKKFEEERHESHRWDFV